MPSKFEEWDKEMAELEEHVKAERGDDLANPTSKHPKSETLAV